MFVGNLRIIAIARSRIQRVGYLHSTEDEKEPENAHDVDLDMTCVCPFLRDVPNFEKCIFCKLRDDRF